MPREIEGPEAGTVLRQLTMRSGLNGYKFTGKERDAESGLDYFGARYYGSNLGRFMTPDPIGFASVRLRDPQTLNAYRYTRGNPINAIDPNGLYDFKCSTGIKDCKAAAQNFEKIRQANLKSEDKAVVKAAKALGTAEEKENGVTVTAMTKKEVEQATKDSSAAGFTTGHPAGPDKRPDVRVGIALSGDEAVDKGRVAHESSHVEDYLWFLGSYDGRFFDASKNISHYDTEFKAYSIQVCAQTNACGPDFYQRIESALGKPGPGESAEDHVKYLNSDVFPNSEEFPQK